MTQHAVMQDTQEDTRTMKNLRNFIGLFAVFALAMAVGVALLAP